jgi:hypothetical protein
VRIPERKRTMNEKRATRRRREQARAYVDMSDIERAEQTEKGVEGGERNLVLFGTDVSWEEKTKKRTRREKRRKYE